jgi:hypothetical protein
MVTERSDPEPGAADATDQARGSAGDAGEASARAVDTAPVTNNRASDNLSATMARLKLATVALRTSATIRAL